MCAVFEVSVSGYRAWQRGGIPGRERLTDAQMLAIIRTFMLNSRARMAALA